MIEVRPATPADADDITRIYNAGIAERAFTFETQARDAADLARRLADPDSPPLLVAEEEGRVVGWTGLSPYSARACYAGIGEASIYLDPAARGRRIGVQLGRELGRHAAARGYWKIVGLALAENARSLHVAEAAGARIVGTLRRHAQLDGKWRDVAIFEVLLEPNVPDDRP